MTIAPHKFVALSGSIPSIASLHLPLFPSSTTSSPLSTVTLSVNATIPSLSSSPSVSRMVSAACLVRSRTEKP